MLPVKNLQQQFENATIEELENFESSVRAESVLSMSQLILNE